MMPTAPWILATWPRKAADCCPTILSAGKKLTSEEGLACDTSTSAPSRASVREWSLRKLTSAGMWVLNICMDEKRYRQSREKNKTK